MIVLRLVAAVWEVLVELAPWLLIGTVVASLLHRFVPASLVRRQLRGRAGVLKAVVLGVPLPLCSCGVIPAGIGLKKDGASNGAAVGFLISTPQTGVDSILVAASMLGWPFALFKVGSALLSGVVGGLLSDVVSPAVPAAGAVQAVSAVAGGHVPEEPTRSLRDALGHGVEILRSIWRWLLFGVVVSAAMSVFLPADAFSMLGLGTIATAALVLFASLPMYVCATASVPIAAALVASGMPAGAALIFLMAGSATNVATVGAVYRTFGARVLAVYLGTIVVASVGLGSLFDAVLSTAGVRAAVAHGHHSWWGMLSAALLLALLVWFAAQELRGFVAKWRLRWASPHQRVELAVEGMTCNGCANGVSRALLAVDGVSAADVSAEQGRAIISGVADEAALRAAIEAAGYKVA